MPNTNILIVEDQPLIAQDIAFTLEDAGYSISEIAHNSKKAIEALRQNTPDFIILDIDLNSEITGVEIAKLINQQYKLPFVYLTSFSDRATIESVKSTNPMGYIVKPFDEKTLIATIEIALSNFAELWKEKGKEMDISVINKHLETPLTKREFVTLTHLLQGKTNKQLAADLFVSTNTIKTHLSNIFVKTGVNSRAQLFSVINKIMV